MTNPGGKVLSGPSRSLSLKLSDTRVYEPQIRARLGATAHFCEVVVLTPPNTCTPGRGSRVCRRDHDRGRDSVHGRKPYTLSPNPTLNPKP